MVKYTPQVGDYFYSYKNSIIKIVSEVKNTTDVYNVEFIHGDAWSNTVRFYSGTKFYKNLMYKKLGKLDLLFYT